MTDISASGELEALTPERVFLELDKALSSDSPQIFIEVVRQCGALAVLFPEIQALFGVPQPEKWHPEIDTGIHTLMAVEQAAKLSADRAVRFAVLVHDLGKALSPKEHLPKHHGHGQKGIAPIKALCARIKVPNEYKDLALIVSDQHQNIHNIEELRPETLIKLFDKADLWRKPHRLAQIILACESDARGRLGLESQPYPQAELFTLAFKRASSVHVKPIIDAGFQGAEIKQQLQIQRIEVVSEVKKTFNKSSV